MSEISYNENNEVVNLGLLIQRKRVSEPHVYILKFIDPNRSFVKVGSTCNLRSRIGSLQIATPYDVQFAYAVKASCVVELQAHDFLKEHRIRGEWFEVDVSDAIHAIRTVLGIAPK